MLVLSLTAQAQDRCSTAMARGTYAVACRGDADLGMGETGLLPAVALGTVFIDGEGSVPSGTLNVSVGGVSSTIAVTGGSGVVNPDCTGEVDLVFGDLTSGRVPGVILDQGATIHAFAPIPGVTAICTLTRISLD
jgi:hypothetical protein